MNRCLGHDDGIYKTRHIWPAMRGVTQIFIIFSACEGTHVSTSLHIEAIKKPLSVSFSGRYVGGQSNEKKKLMLKDIRPILLLHLCFSAFFFCVTVGEWGIEFQNNTLEPHLHSFFFLLLNDVATAVDRQRLYVYFKRDIKSLHRYNFW